MDWAENSCLYVTIYWLVCTNMYIEHNKNFKIMRVTKNNLTHACIKPLLSRAKLKPSTQNIQMDQINLHRYVNSNYENFC